MKDLKAMLKLLEKRYGIPDWAHGKEEPIDLVVSTILSQNTSDKNSFRAFAELKKNYRDWYCLLGEDEEKIAGIIRKGGLPNVKAARIKRTLLKIFEERGELNIDFLRGKDVYSGMEWLQKLPGVGPKTAAVILNFGFGKNVIPVDTHVQRVSERLGIVPKTSAQKVQAILNKDVPGELAYALHVLFIQHGREICKAKNPRCGICPLKNHCEYFKSLQT
jgi:endonuclease-3